MIVKVTAEYTKYGDPIKGSENGTIKGIEDRCAAVVSQAKPLAPVRKKDGGRLRGSISYRTNRKKQGYESAGPESDPSSDKLPVSPPLKSGFVGSNVYYAAHVEFGTRRQRPQPYMRPAIAIKLLRKNAQEVMANIIKTEMEGALKAGERTERFL